jgi:hypothetical protein
MKRLTDMAQGDLWPYKYFRIWENELLDEVFSTVKSDLASLAELKISIRHESNKSDINDHTKDDVYADLTIDTANICHWVPAEGDTDKLGRWVGRIVGKRSGNEPFHSDEWFEYYVTAQGNFGRESI